jgi:hypothetical protein
MAKEKAKEAAMRDAVQKVVGATVTASSESQDFTLVRDIVFSQSSGYIRTYTVLEEKVDEQQEMVTTKIKAEVLKGAIDKDAGAIATLLAFKKQRKIYVLIPDVSMEAVGGKNAPQVATVRHGIFDVAFANRLRDDGFYVLDPNMVDGKLKNRAAVQSLNNPQEAADIADAVGADLIFYGNAVASRVEEGVGLVDNKNVIPVAVRYAISVTAPDSKEQLAGATGTAMLSGYTLADATTNAINKAAELAVKELRAKIFETWRKHMNGPARIVMSVSGLKDFGQYKAFQQLLTSQVRGVKEVSSSKFNKGAAQLDVSLVGTVDGLAGELQGKNFKGQVINVLSASGNTIEVSLGK